jgi:hypothetical protein
VQRSLTAYYDRFKAVLNPINAQNIQRLLHIAAALHSCLQLPQAAPPDSQQQQQPGAGSAHTTAAGATTGGGSSSSSGSRLVTVNDLLFDLGLDNINMFELAHWVRDNKMAFKVRLKLTELGWADSTGVAACPAVHGSTSTNVGCWTL